MLRHDQQAMIAYALEVEAELLPFVPELLDGLEELGSNASSMVDIVAELDLPSEPTIVDLGCGKGATAIAIAGQLDYRVLGIDLFRPFIDHCVRSASASSVTHLCTFRHGDILTADQDHPDFLPADVAIFAALGDVLGPLDQTVGILRRYVHPGGFLLVVDDYVRDGHAPDFPRFEGYVSKESTVEKLVSHGDRLVKVVETSNPEVAQAQTDSILSQVEILSARYPEMRPVFAKFAADQQAETDFLAEKMVEAIWVLEIRH